MANMVHWNLQELGSAINALENRREHLSQGREHMRAQQARVGHNWQSPAGRQYQKRLQEDMALLNDILGHLHSRIESLRRVQQIYTDAESTIRVATINQLR